MAKRIVDERSRVPVKSGNPHVDETMVRIAMQIIKDEWPEEFGDVHVPPVSPEEELDCFLRARIRERNGWKPPEEEMRAERRALLRLRTRKVNGWDDARRRRTLLTALDSEFGPVVPKGCKSRKPVLRLIQGGRKSWPLLPRLG